MRSLFLMAGACLVLSGCADWTGIGPGNPDGAAYAGAPDSVYDAAANPPRTIGTVSYNPQAAPTPVSDLPTPGPGAVPMAPYNNMPANGAMPGPQRPLRH
jgi:hypothetical protein